MAEPNPGLFMNRLRLFIKTNLLVIAITAAIGLAFAIPGVGVALKAAHLVPPMIMVIFFCQGIGIRTDDLKQIPAYAGLVVWGGVIAHGLAPLLAWLTTRFLGWQGDQQVGFILMCCMAPTLVSGIVIAVQAGGHQVTGLMMTVCLNLLAIFTIPLNLRWTLGSSAPIDQVGLLTKLVFAILLPAIVGQSFGRWRPGFVARHRSAIRHVPVVLLGATVFISLSSQVGQLHQIRPGQAVALLLASLTVHYLLLASGYAGARWGLRAPESRCRALAIVCSQKTIPVAVAVWAMLFQSEYPLAIIPAIVFHLSQIYADGLLARYWATHPVEDAARASSAGVSRG